MDLNAVDVEEGAGAFVGQGEEVPLVWREDEGEEGGSLRGQVPVAGVVAGDDFGGGVNQHRLSLHFSRSCVQTDGIRDRHKRTPHAHIVHPSSITCVVVLSSLAISPEISENLLPEVSQTEASTIQNMTSG